MTIDELIFLIIGIIIGGIFSTEYVRWRLGIGDIKKYIHKLEQVGYDVLSMAGVDPQEWRAASVERRRELLRVSLSGVFKSLLPVEVPMSKPPLSHILGLDGSQFFVPQCPKCHYAAAPLRASPGERVQSVCPNHGVYVVSVTEPKEVKKR